MLNLSEKTYNNEETNALIEHLNSDKRLTAGEKVIEFENKFAHYIGQKYAVMVNSGSSANLLAVAAVCNPTRLKKLNKGDKVIVPSLCWSTSVFPLLQYDLVPVFLDIDFENLNIIFEEEDFIDIKGIMMVHALGNSTNMKKLMEIVKKKDIIVIEDTCESLGSSFDNKTLGTFGDFGTFSFYFSHHITTIEGGMVICKTEEDYELLKCLRAHGWDRDQKIRKKYDNIDPRFCFINTGYNLRSTELNALMGLIQLEKFEFMSKLRKENRTKIINAIMAHPLNKNLINYHKETSGCKTNWFSIPLYIEDENIDKDDFLSYLEENGIENRPIISGNFTRQPILKLYNIDTDFKKFKNAEKVNNQSFYLGCPTFYDFDENKIANTILNYWGPIIFYKEPYNIAEGLEYIKETLDSTWISRGGKFNDLCTEKLKEITETQYVIPTITGTSALHCMVKCAKKFYPNVKRIYAPNNVYIALWNILLQEYPKEYLKCLDIDEKTLNIENIDNLEKNSILFVVHNISGVTNVPKLKRERPDMKIFEDASEGYLGKYENKMVGSAGEASTLSFNMNKHFTCGSGGAFCTNNEEFYNYINLFVKHGLTNKKFCYEDVGNNYCLSNLNAALLWSQIKQVDKIMELREKIFNSYKEKIKGVCEIQKTSNNTELSYWFVCLKIKGLKSYDIIESFFKNHSIELRPMFYNLQEFDYIPKNIFPKNSNAKLINNENFIVPCYPSITEREILRVVEVLKKFIN